MLSSNNSSDYHFHIADDHPLFRTALTQVIKVNFADAKITQSQDLSNTLEQLNQEKELDLLLLDLHMPGSMNLFGLVNIRERFPSVPVVIVSASEDQDTVNRAIGHGAIGYITKSLSQEMMSEAIKHVLNGSQWIPDKYRQALHPISEEEKSIATKVASLTPQQYRVLCLLKEGWLNKQIGFEMGVTEATIKAHITSIFKKLGVTNRVQALIELNKLSFNDSHDMEDQTQQAQAKR